MALLGAHAPFLETEPERFDVASTAGRLASEVPAVTLDFTTEPTFWSALEEHLAGQAAGARAGELRP